MFGNRFIQGLLAISLLGFASLSNAATIPIEVYIGNNGAGLPAVNTQVGTLNLTVSSTGTGTNLTRTATFQITGGAALGSAQIVGVYFETGLDFWLRITSPTPTVTNGTNVNFSANNNGAVANSPLAFTSGYFGNNG